MRSSRTNGQLSKLKSIKKRSPHICMFKGHFEVREVRLLWKRIASCALSGQGWPTEEACWFVAGRSQMEMSVSV